VAGGGLTVPYLNLGSASRADYNDSTSQSGGGFPVFSLLLLLREAASTW